MTKVVRPFLSNNMTKYILCTVYYTIVSLENPILLDPSWILTGNAQIKNALEEMLYNLYGSLKIYILV